MGVLRALPPFGLHEGGGKVDSCQLLTISAINTQEIQQTIAHKATMYFSPFRNEEMKNPHHSSRNSKKLTAVNFLARPAIIPARSLS